MCTSTRAIISEQENIRRIVEAHPERPLEPAAQSEVGVVAQLELNDLKTKVHRLTKQATEHIAKLSFFSFMSEKVDLMERQIHRWRYRLPDLTDDENHEPSLGSGSARTVESVSGINKE